MAERLWSYQEIKFIRIHAATSSDELAKSLNENFHNGEVIRSAVDVNMVKRQRSIF